MSTVSRREFLVHASNAVGAVAAAGSIAAAGPSPRRLTSGADQVTLGRSGLKCSLIGMGTGSVGVKRSSNQVKLGQEKFTKLVRHAVDSGITYFDTADQYGSHLYLREALRGVPRDKLFIQSKTRALNAEVAKVDLDRFREELGVDYIDSMLMHCMTKGTWPTDMRPVMDVLSDAKAKGVVRAIGISCHGMAPLRAAPSCGWIDIQLARINPVGVSARMDGSPDEVVPCLRSLHDAGKGVLGMKILGEGTLKSAEQQLESLRFVIGLGCVDAMVIGFESPEQIDQIMKRVETVLRA